MITLPKEWKTYSHSIRDRCRDLIEFRIWNGLDIHQLDNWRKNFKSDEEKYMSACILDSLIYRSNSQTFSLINQLLYKNLNNLFRLLGRKDLQNFPHCLTEKKTDPLVRLVPAITSNHPPTKSSNEILRFIKRHFHVCEKWIVNPWKIEDELKKHVKAFIFIDDFLGTGSQFEEVVYDSNIVDVIKNNLIVYAPLVAHEDGLENLQAIFPNLKVTFTEKLNRSAHLFFDNYFPDEVDEAKKFYLDMLSNRGIDLLGDEHFGFGNLELTFAFEHAAPDNSLHALHKRTENWVPLFNR